MSIWDSENKMLIMFLKDLGFEEWDNVPYWIQELAHNLIENGWIKK